jgi:hypothetical protein
MKTLKPILFAALLAGCSSGAARQVSGTILAAHPAGTSVLAIGATTRQSAAVMPDGSFSLSLPIGAIYRLHAVTQRAGHPAILGTLTSRGRALRIDTRSKTSALSLGKIGSATQTLAAPDPSKECTTDGDALDTEHDGNEGGVDAGEPEGANNDADGGENDQHDDVCQQGEGEHGNDPPEADGGSGPDEHGEH